MAKLCVWPVSRMAGKRGVTGSHSSVFRTVRLTQTMISAALRRTLSSRTKVSVSVIGIGRRSRIFMRSVAVVLRPRLDLFLLDQFGRIDPANVEFVFVQSPLETFMDQALRVRGNADPLVTMIRDPL